MHRDQQRMAKARWAFLLFVLGFTLLYFSYQTGKRNIVSYEEEIVDQKPSKPITSTPSQNFGSKDNTADENDKAAPQGDEDDQVSPKVDENESEDDDEPSSMTVTSSIAPETSSPSVTPTSTIDTPVVVNKTIKIKEGSFYKYYNLDDLLSSYLKRYEEARKPETAHTFKYLKWAKCYAGWGNRFSSIISGLVLGLALDRLFYIDDYADYSPYITQVTEVNWKFQKEILDKTDAGKKCQANEYNVAYGGGQPPKSLLTSWLNEDHRKRDECIYKNPLGDGDYTAPIFQRNPHYAELFEDTLPPALFGPLFRWLYKPTQKIIDEAKPVREVMEKAKFSIGIHVRSGKWKSMQNSMPYKDFCDLAKSLARGSGFRKEDIVMFVSADNQEKSLPALKDCLAPYKMINTPPASGKTDAGNVGTDLAALTDMFLLSNCTEIIATIGSSFGSVAASIESKQNWYVTTGAHTSIENPAYFKQVTSEPCMYVTKPWLRQEGDEKTANFRKDGQWQQYAMCHPVDAEYGGTLKKRKEQGKFY